MANHVYYNIELSLDEAGSELVKNLRDSIENEAGSEFKWKEWNLEQLPIYPKNYDENDWYSWGCEMMGAKWVTCEEFEDTHLTGYSAWSPIFPLVENLIQFISDNVGGEPTARMTYEDEFRNFVGVADFWVEDGDVQYDYNEIEGDELTTMVEELFGMEVDSEEFNWWDDFPVVLDGSQFKTDRWVPQEYIDELVYNFFDTGELRHL